MAPAAAPVQVLSCPPEGWSGPFLVAAFAIGFLTGASIALAGGACAAAVAWGARAAAARLLRGGASPAYLLGRAAAERRLGGY